MMKDFAKTVSLPPAEAMAALKLMTNYLGSVLPLNFGKVIGLSKGGQGELWSPSDNGDLGSMDL